MAVDMVSGTDDYDLLYFIFLLNLSVCISKTSISYWDPLMRVYVIRFFYVLQILLITFPQ